MFDLVFTGSTGIGPLRLLVIDAVVVALVAVGGEYFHAAFHAKGDVGAEDEADEIDEHYCVEYSASKFG